MLKFTIACLLGGATAVSLDQGSAYINSNFYEFHVSGDDSTAFYEKNVEPIDKKCRAIARNNVAWYNECVTCETIWETFLTDVKSQCKTGSGSQNYLNMSNMYNDWYYDTLSIRNWGCFHDGGGREYSKTLR